MTHNGVPRLLEYVSKISFKQSRTLSKNLFFNLIRIGNNNNDVLGFKRRLSAQSHSVTHSSIIVCNLHVHVKTYCERKVTHRIIAHINY